MAGYRSYVFAARALSLRAVLRLEQDALDGAARAFVVPVLVTERAYRTGYSPTEGPGLRTQDNSYWSARARFTGSFQATRS